MKENSNNLFCVVPWRTLTIQQNGDVNLCCRSFHHPSSKMGSLFENDIKEIWNSVPYQKIRQTFIDNKIPPECKDCAQSSFKVEQNNLLSPLGKKNILLDTGEIESLDIRGSNICNCKCRICEPAFSTAWYADGEKIGSYVPEGPLCLNSKQIDFIVSLLPQLKKLYFAGGEPLLDPTHRFLINHPSLKSNTHIEYNSNFTGPQEFFERWSHFSSLSISISLDAYGKLAEYIRKGINFDHVVSNIIETRERCPQSKLTLNPTISVFNIHDLGDILEEFVLRLKLFKPNEINLNILHNPLMYNIKCIPTSQKSVAKKNLTISMKKILLHFHDKSYAPFFNQLKTIIDFMDAEDLSSHYPSFLELTKELDILRGESFPHRD